MSEASKPKIAVHKFSSCDGCQLTMLSLEDELLALASKVDIAYFLEARSSAVEGPYDISLVEGSITTEHDIERIEKIRDESKVLISIGACAVAGGIQSLRNWANVDVFVSAVYATPAYIRTLQTSMAVSERVVVDYELSGCPVNKKQLLEVLLSLLAGRTPNIPAYSVCIDCKRAGNPCVMVSGGMVCMGPVTHTGCGALCPSFNRGCYGCFGPSETSHSDTLVEYLLGQGHDTAELIRLMRGISGYAQPFRASSEKLEKAAL